MQATGATQAGNTMARNILDTRPYAASNQRLLSEDSAMQYGEPETVDDVLMKDVPPTAPKACRKLHLFTHPNCGHAYISPPCACCTGPANTLTAATFHSMPVHSRLAALMSFSLKTYKFKVQCPACQELTLSFNQEFAKQDYEEKLALWGETDEDTIRDKAVFSKSTAACERVGKAISREFPEMTGWEQIDAGCGKVPRANCELSSTSH